MSWKRYLIICFATFVSILVAASAFNISIDVENVYRARRQSDFYDKYVQQLLEASDGLVAMSPERSVKIRLARRALADCFIVGSSQEMQIDLATMPSLASRCESIANAAVSGGSFEDFLTTAAIVAHNPKARRLFVGLHPWSFRAGADKRWTEEAAAYADARAYFGFAPAENAGDGTTAPLRNLINGPYLWQNLEVLRDKGLKALSPLEIRAGNTATNDEKIYLRTGRLVYSHAFLTTSPLAVARIGAGDFKIAAPWFNPMVVSEFERALDRLAAANVAVEFLLLPYHPQVMDCANRMPCDALAAVEIRAREIASRRNIPVLGSFDPRPMGFRPNDFLDSAHLSASALSRLKT
jgi:hypothetical protein